MTAMAVRAGREIMAVPGIDIRYASDLATLFQHHKIDRAIAMQVGNGQGDDCA